MEKDADFFVRAGKAKKSFSSWLAQNVYPVIIAIASMLVLVFVPMIGTTAAIGTLIPTAPLAAFIFWTLKALTVGLNLAIFAAFRLQAKKAVKDNPSYIEANMILGKHKPSEYRPLSPGKFAAKQWSIKGTLLALSTGVTTLALTNIVLSYD